MKNRAGGRLSKWRSFRRSKHRAGRQPQAPGTARDQSPAGQDAAGRPALTDSEVTAGQVTDDEAAAGGTMADAVQLAIGLLTASLDSPELEAWAAAALTPHDPDGLGNFMAGLHVVAEMLLQELNEATDEPPEEILQRLAILAEHRRGMPSAG